MLDYIEMFELPAIVAAVIIAIYCIMQLIGDILTFKGKVVPEFMRVKHWLQKRKEARNALSRMPEIVDEVKSLLDNVNQHYSDDNITKRNAWMNEVTDRGIENRQLINMVSGKLDAQSKDILELIIENKRNTIIDFAARVSNTDNLFTREQFNRVMKIYSDYEDIITKNGMTNGEVDIAYRIITEAYEECLKNNTFIEDIRGY